MFRPKKNPIEQKFTRPLGPSNPRGAEWKVWRALDADASIVEVVAASAPFSSRQDASLMASSDDTFYVKKILVKFVS